MKDHKDWLVEGNWLQRGVSIIGHVLLVQVVGLLVLAATAGMGALCYILLGLGS